MYILKKSLKLSEENVESIEFFTCGYNPMVIISSVTNFALLLEVCSALRAAFAKLVLIGRRAGV